MCQCWVCCIAKKNHGSFVSYALWLWRLSWHLPSIHPSEKLSSIYYLYRFFPGESTGSVPKGGVCIVQPEGRDQRWVCVSQLMRVSTDRLHHQHPTLTAVEDSILNITEPRHQRGIIQSPTDQDWRLCLLTLLFVGAAILQNRQAAK